MGECISCKAKTSESVNMACSSCKSKITRCAKCRRLSIEYTCSCGLTGP